MWISNSLGKCKYCGKQVRWIRTKAGKNMPVNLELISYRRLEAGGKAAEKIVTQAGEVVCADKVDGGQAEGVGYISHFATCIKRRR